VVWDREGVGTQRRNPSWRRGDSDAADCRFFPVWGTAADFLP